MGKKERDANMGTYSMELAFSQSASLLLLLWDTHSPKT